MKEGRRSDFPPAGSVPKELQKPRPSQVEALKPRAWNFSPVFHLCPCETLSKLLKGPELKGEPVLHTPALTWNGSVAESAVICEP